MIFSSTIFLMLFLPAVWLIHAIIPRHFLKARNLFLSLASLLFYAYGEPLYLFLMLASVLCNYCFALLLERAKDRGKRIVCALAVVVNIAMLGVFKYSPWIVSMVNSAAGLSLPVPQITIPVGISFYTFQILSYVIDVKRGKTCAQKNLFDLLLYVSFFPQLIAGPIVKYGDIRDQIEHRTITAEKTAVGIRRFIYGLSKKVLISNIAAIIADAAFAQEGLSALFAWMGAICYCIQLYFDFSGYSDMAIGLASMFGFSLNENFNYPYASVSIRDFWKRWHISLTSWFREYVYIPLGGNRNGKARTVLNKFFIFFLTGLWHGANFTFVVWGLWHGLFMMLEQLIRFERFTEKPWLRPLTRAYTLLAVCLGFVVFRAPDMSTALTFICAMFSSGASPADALGFLSPYNCIALCTGLIFSMPVLPWLRNKACGNSLARHSGEVLGYLLCIPLLFLCILSLATSSFNPFIYYHF